MGDPALRHGGPDAGWYRPTDHGWQRIGDGEVGDHDDAAHFMSDPNGRHETATVAGVTADHVD